MVEVRQPWSDRLNEFERELMQNLNEFEYLLDHAASAQRFVSEEDFAAIKRRAESDRHTLLMIQQRDNPDVDATGKEIVDRFGLRKLPPVEITHYLDECRIALAKMEAYYELRKQSWVVQTGYNARTMGWDGASSMLLRLAGCVFDFLMQRVRVPLFRFALDYQTRHEPLALYVQRRLVPELELRSKRPVRKPSREDERRRLEREMEELDAECERIATQARTKEEQMRIRNSFADAKDRKREQWSKYL